MTTVRTAYVVALNPLHAQRRAFSGDVVETYNEAQEWQDACQYPTAIYPVVVSVTVGEAKEGAA